ncbi:CAP domain-containing protein [Streptomyces sp. NPDC090046]|uniref:CAP domain-containing protein n=1 Tax=Streptomyces sp. NPDC090046 TaxID=3365928 RepID=UPI00382D5C79
MHEHEHQPVESLAHQGAGPVHDMERRPAKSRRRAGGRRAVRTRSGARRSGLVVSAAALVAVAAGAFALHGTGGASGGADRVAASSSTDTDAGAGAGAGADAATEPAQQPGPGTPTGISGSPLASATPSGAPASSPAAAASPSAEVRPDAAPSRGSKPSKGADAPGPAPAGGASGSGPVGPDPRVAGPRVSSQAVRDAEAMSLKLLNGERATVGLAPLVLKDDLSGFAREWARHMRTSGFGHSGSKDTGHLVTGSRTWVGENIVMWSDESMTAQQAAEKFQSMWRHSPGHYKAQTSRTFTEVGVGIYHDESGWWGVHNFSDGR